VTTISQEQARQRGAQRPPRLLTIEDVAHYLGVSERWIYEQVRSGRLPAMLIARSWRLRREAVDEFADSFTCPAPTKASIGSRAPVRTVTEPVDKGWRHDPSKYDG